MTCCLSPLRKELTVGFFTQIAIVRAGRKETLSVELKNAPWKSWKRFVMVALHFHCPTTNSKICKRCFKMTWQPNCWKVLTLWILWSGTATAIRKCWLMMAAVYMEDNAGNPLSYTRRPSARNVRGGMHYIGNTQQKLKEPMNQHFSKIARLVNDGMKSDSFMNHFASHFTGNNKDVTRQMVQQMVKIMDIIWQGDAISCMKLFGRLSCKLCIAKCLAILKMAKENQTNLLTQDGRFTAPAGTKRGFAGTLWMD